jgi:transposase
MVAAFDVSKDVLDMSHGQRVSRLENKAASIDGCLKQLPSGCVVAMESTGKYHRQLAKRALKSGFEVYVVNPKRFVAYKRSEAVRGKTDRLDAQALELFVTEKKDRLKPYREPSKFVEQLRELVVRRETLVETKIQALSSLEGIEVLKGERASIEKTFEKVLKQIDLKIAELLKQSESAPLLLKVPGFGDLTTAGLLTLLDRYEFESADAFVAYLGLDPRPNDSGKRKGIRYLSCEGDSSVRRLLYNAAMSASCTSAWKPYYKKQIEKGLSRTEALLILARKLARTAWSIHKNHAEFVPDRVDKQP